MMVKYAGGSILRDVYIMPPRPYLCPDCHTMHKGECPVEVQKSLVSKFVIIDELREALEDHAKHISQIIDSVASVVKGLEDQEAAIVQLHERLGRLEAALGETIKRHGASTRRRRGPMRQ